MDGVVNGSAYYNERDPYAAAWLRNLIAAGHIAPGHVDERSIVDVQPDDLAGYAQCHFFAGIGGWSLALRIAGWSDQRPVWTGSCPCQPFSVAGVQRGFDDSRHLWPEFRRLIAERRPPDVFGEQVAGASAWLGLVRSDLEALDYAVGAIPIEAASAGADHKRDRFWFVADSQMREQRGLWEPVTRSGRRQLPARGYGGDARSVADADEPRASQEWEQRGRQQRGPCRNPTACPCDLADTDKCGRSSRPYDQTSGHGSALAADGGTSVGRAYEWLLGADGKARRVKPGLRLLAHGVPARVGRLRALGNAIDPRPAAAFIETYLDIEGGRDA